MCRSWLPSEQGQAMGRGGVVGGRGFMWRPWLPWPHGCRRRPGEFDFCSGILLKQKLWSSGLVGKRPSPLPPMFRRLLLPFKLLLASRDDHLGNLGRQGRRGQHLCDTLGNPGLRLEFCWECRSTRWVLLPWELAEHFPEAKLAPAGPDQAQSHLPGEQLCH